MAITTQLVGKLGGLNWNKIPGEQKTIAWDSTGNYSKVLTQTSLFLGPRYIFAARYNYVSGTPGNTLLGFGEKKQGSDSYPEWVVNDTVTAIESGERFYEFSVVKKLTSSGIVYVQLLPGYQSGTHVLSADLYYAALDDIPQ